MHVIRIHDIGRSSILVLYYTSGQTGINTVYTTTTCMHVHVYAHPHSPAAHIQHRQQCIHIHAHKGHAQTCAATCNAVFPVFLALSSTLDPLSNILRTAAEFPFRAKVCISFAPDEELPAECFFGCPRPPPAPSLAPCPASDMRASDIAVTWFQTRFFFNFQTRFFTLQTRFLVLPGVGIFK